MAFGTQDDSDEVMNEINMTPLVDVMLVLLIVFIITVPVMKHAVNVDLPRASNEPEVVKPQTISLSIDAQGEEALRLGNGRRPDSQFQAQRAGAVVAGAGGQERQRGPGAGAQVGAQANRPVAASDREHVDPVRDQGAAALPSTGLVGPASAVTHGTSAQAP